MKKVFLAGVLFVIAIAAGCESPYEQGVQRIDLPGGERLYFKRQMYGLNGDSLGLSKDGDPCHDLNETHDYVYRAQGPVGVYYAIDHGKLKLYSSSRLYAPSGKPLRGRIEGFEMNPLEAEEMRRSYQARGLKKLDVTVKPQC